MKTTISSLLIFWTVFCFGQNLQSVYENYKKHLSNKDYKQAGQTLDSLLTMDPTNNYWLIGKAEISAALGKRKEAIFYLNKSIDNGYRNLEAILKNEYFVGFAKSKEFIENVGSLKAELLDYKLNESEQSIIIDIPPLMECYVIMLYLSNPNHPLINKKRNHFYFSRIDEYFEKHQSSEHLKKIGEWYPGDKELWINNLRAHHNLRTLYVYDSLNTDAIARFPLELNKELAELVRDFAVESNFMEFYQQNKSFYSAMKKIMKTNYAFGSNLISFFNENFIQKINRFNIYFSPIYGGWQHGPTAKVDDYIECFYFGGIMYTPNEEFYYPDVFLLFTFLTEFDHTTINMLTEEFADQVEVLKDKTTILNTSGKVSYGSIKSTVNEYLTWAFALQFFYEHTPSDYHELEENIVWWMENGRSFSRFGEFMKFYKKYMDNRIDYPLLEDFYHEVINWISMVE